MNLLKIHATLALFAPFLCACAHQLHVNSAEIVEELVGDPLSDKTGQTLVEVSATAFAIIIELQDGAYVDQEIATVQVIDDTVIPWSGYALVQFGLMSWNPVAWLFPRLWTEPQPRDHSVLRDWLRLWNPFVRAGGDFTSERRVRRRVIETEVKRVDHQRMPRADLGANLTLRVGSTERKIRRITDGSGRIHVSFDVLPPQFRRTRPITIEVDSPQWGSATAQIF